MKIITFDVEKNTNVEGMIAVFKAFKSWACITEHTWLVYAPDTDCNTIRNILQGMFPKHLLVVSFSGSNCDWATYDCSKDINGYLHNNL